MDEQRNDGVQEEELERYGVWVKAGPEEVVEAEEDFSFADLPQNAPDEVAPREDIDTATPDEPVAEDLSDLDDLNFEDLDIDGNVEFETDDAPGDSAQPIAEEPAARDAQLDDFAADDLSVASDTPEETEFTLGDKDDLVSLDDLNIEEPESEPDPFSGLSEMEQEVAVDAPDTLGADEDTHFDETIPGSDDELSDISLEDVNVDEESEILPELEADGPMRVEDSAPFDESVESMEDEEHSFTPEQQGIEIIPQTPTNRLTADEEEFLDESSKDDAIADLQNDSESDIPNSMDLQERQAFDRIQNELADIKKELADLKAALRAGASPQVDEIETPVVNETLDIVGGVDSSAEEDESHGPGFFEDEEDETIALTGDELDNILNTAEFTEQVGEAEELDEDFLVEDDLGAGTANDVIPSFEDDTPESSLATDETEPVAEDMPHLGDVPEEEGPSPAVTEESIHVDDATPEEAAPVVSDIEMEPIARQPVVFEGDESAVDELAEMDIDRELVDIEGLTDDSASEELAGPDEIEIDIDDIESLDTSGVLEEGADEQAHTAAVESDQQALADVPETLDEDEIDHVEVESQELVADSGDRAFDSSGEIIEQKQAVEGFDEFAAAVEEDITASESGVELDETFDIEEDTVPVEDTAPESTADVDEEEIEIDLADLDDFDNLDDTEVSLEEPIIEGAPAPEDEEMPLEAEGMIDVSGEDESVEADLTHDIDLSMEIGASESVVEAAEPEGVDLTISDADEDGATTYGDVTEEIDLSAEIETPESPAETVAVDTTLSSVEQVQEEGSGKEESATAVTGSSIADLPDDLKQEIRSVLSYMDQLLEALPDDKIEEFAQSDHFEVYKRLFEELELET
ncbi:MAG: hypothetical protein MI724_03745 [Spirochaetales bacterium]|nr:hypothetical protein [Spirochaetales bacterium]